MVTDAERIVAGCVGGGLLAVAVWSAARAKRMGRLPVEPLAVFLFVWGVALVLFAIPWVRYIESPARTWVAVYGSIVAFTLGALAVYRCLPERSDSRPPEEPSLPGVRLVWAGALVLGLVGFAAYVRAVDAVLGWQALFDEPSVVRDIQTTSDRFDQTYGPWRLLTYFNTVAFLVWTLALRGDAFRGRWALLAPLGVLSLVPFLFTGERTLLSTTLIWTAFFHLVWRPLPGWRRLLTISGAAAVTLVIAFVAIGARVDKTIDTHPEISRALTTESFRAVALPYVYLTGNVPTLSRLMEDPTSPQTHGKMTLLPGVKVLHAAGIGGEPPEEVGAFYPIPFETFNNYSWLGSFYLDFGVIGCLVLPFLFGAVAAGATRIATRRRTLLAAWTLSLVLYVVAFSPLLNKLSTTLTWQFFLLGPILMPFLRQDSRVARVLGDRIRSLGSPRARRALLVAALLVVGGTTAVVATRGNDQRAATQVEVIRRMHDAAGRSRQIFASTGLPSSQALASQLRVADPGTRFVALASFSDLPTEARTIGVFAARNDVWLWTRGGEGRPVGVHIIMTGAARGTYSQGDEPANLVTNGDLEVPIERPWQISASPNSRIQPDPELSWASNASLRVTGTGVDAEDTAFITQVIRQLPTRRAGAIYTMRMHSFSRRLSRALPAAMKFEYTDGTVQFTQAQTGTAGDVNGRAGASIPANTGQFWHVATATAAARKPLRSIQLFLVDTGAGKLHGTAWIDGVSLVAGDGLVRFPPPR